MENARERQGNAISEISGKGGNWLFSGDSVRVSAILHILGNEMDSEGRCHVDLNDNHGVTRLVSYYQEYSTHVNYKTQCCCWGMGHLHCV